MTAAPGARVLAIASSLPLGRVADWAAVVANPGVDPATVNPAAAADIGVPLLHRCAAAMPWEWRQANALSDQERLRVAARHMRMAAISGHFTGRACEQVMRLFEERKPIGPSPWRARPALLSTAQGQGGGEDPGWAFKRSRAAEVIPCLQHFDTVEGCADILYATRLAGAPLNLNPAAAVA